MEAIKEKKKNKARITFDAVVAPPPVPEPRGAMVNTDLGNTEMLAEMKKQIDLVATVIGVNNPLTAQMVRPVLKLLVDEATTIIARLDKGEAA